MNTAYSSSRSKDIPWLGDTLRPLTGERLAELLKALITGEQEYWGTVEVKYEASQPVLVKRTTTESLRSTRGGSNGQF